MTLAPATLVYILKTIGQQGTIIPTRDEKFPDINLVFSEISPVVYCLPIHT